ncbi:MAG: enoyl-CoA hydratase-related protein [Actinomycetota bacterium]|nr:enoyl-CoA hydratase-related protein [Actinomycetota bacterium]
MVHTGIRGGIATITLQRPHRLNALTWSGMDEIRAAVSDLTARDDVFALVITGAGRGFSAGLDLIDLDADVGDLSASVQHEMTVRLNPMCRAILDAPVPVLAAVNGPCAGGGLGLALLADVTIAAQSAYFLVPQVDSLSIVPDAGVTWTLPRLVGRARALGMSLTGARIDAQQAERWGLIWRCVPDDEVLNQVYAFAGKLAGNRYPVVATRELIDNALTSSLADQLLAETRAQSVALREPEAVERIRRFAVKS